MKVFWLVQSLVLAKCPARIETRQSRNFVQDMVATSAAEEGLDIRDCDFIVWLCKFDTTNSHLQYSGRASAAHTQIY